MRINRNKLVITALLLALITTGCGLDALGVEVPDIGDTEISVSSEDVKEAVERASEVTKEVAEKVKEKADEAEITQKVEDAAKIGAEKLQSAGEAGAEKLKESMKQGVKKGLESAKDIDDEKVHEILNETLKSAMQSGKPGALTSSADLELTDIDGKGKNYSFTYGGEEFSATYKTDNWKIVDSYRIDNEADMKIICQSLIDEHPVHGKDMVSYRTADDMVYEWQLHNIAYAFLSDDETLINKAKDVDFNPEDQGRTLEELYYSRTGKELNIEDFLH